MLRTIYYFSKLVYYVVKVIYSLKRLTRGGRRKR